MYLPYPCIYDAGGLLQFFPKKAPKSLKKGIFCPKKWRLIRNFKKWRFNQEWRCICEDTAMPILNDYSNCKLTFYPMSSLPNKSLQHPRITVLFCMYQYYIAETNSQLGHCDENDLVGLLSSPSWLHITLWVRNGCYFLSFSLSLS